MRARQNVLPRLTRLVRYDLNHIEELGRQLRLIDDQTLRTIAYETHGVSECRFSRVNVLEVDIVILRKDLPHER